MQANRSVADVTTVLRDARERAGLGLDELSARTRIKRHFLEALERGDYARLPGDFFARAFLRTCARELGLTPETLVREYDAAQARVPPPASSGPAGVSPDTTLVSRRRTPAMRWMALATSVLLIPVALVLTRGEAERPQTAVPAAAPPVVGTAGSGQPASGEPRTATWGAAAALPGLSLELTTTADTWLSASADGRRVVYRLLRPGEQLSLEADEALSLRLGNAGAVEYSLNGQPGVPLGPAGGVRSVHITRENYRAFQR